MRDSQTVAWYREVQEALKHYNHADELDRHDARLWPVVQAATASGVGLVGGVRRVLEEAIRELQHSRHDEAALLWEHYVRGRSIEVLAVEYKLDPSNLYRRRGRLIKELAVLLAERNRFAERRARAEHFRPRLPIIGFDALADELAARLHALDAPLVVVVEGMGGLGKTTLARMVAAQCLEQETFAGVLWATAKQLDFDVWSGRRRGEAQPINAADLIHQLARDLKIEPGGDLKALLNEVRAHCRRGTYLIVLDNLESVSDIAAVAPLVEALAGPSRILITTRESAHMALPAELARHYLLLDELDRPVSYRLLRRAAQTTGAPALTRAGEDDLAQIYGVTGGNPLALWLIAGQARGMPWATFVRDLVDHCPAGSKGFELYSYLYRRSWDQLSPEARVVLFAMHRCEAGAEHSLLLALSQLEAGAFLRAVEELEQCMLLQFDERYTIHRLTYSFLRVVVAGWWE